MGLDPACGSGTFLIERYRQVVGEVADAGLADYAEGRAVVERLHGNDLNPFSAIVTQIQMLWHLLAFGTSVRRTGFPDLRVSERANSLVPVTLFDPAQNRFGEIDRSGYGAVAGNPPYIRPERGSALEAHAREWFEAPRTVNGKTFAGMPVGRNAYPLFIYRALDHWCRQPENGAAGLLGFVIPLGLCGSRETAHLREMFKVGARWAVREIVDMELIWRDIFDADVLPMILIAEARPATTEDVVVIRLADESCVHHEEGARKPTFRFFDLPEHRVRYEDIIAPDGAILMRLTESRTVILRKLWGCERLEAAALVFWSRRTREGTQATTREPTGAGANRWQRDILIKDGARLRGQVVAANGAGLDVYKGENITASRFTGDPVHRGLDITKASAPSIWAYANILPEVVYALPTIERVPVAAPFNPHHVAVLNTCAVFAPRPDLSDVPFDVVLLSRVYSWFYVVAGRRSFLNKLRSHIYPTSVAALPWSEAIAGRSAELTALRGTVLAACHRLFEQQSAMREAAEALGMQELRRVGRSLAGARIARSQDLGDDDEFILSVGGIDEAAGEWTLALGDDGQAVAFNSEVLASLARAGLLLRNGDLMKWSTILRTPIPIDQAMADKLQIIVESFDPTVLEENVEKEVDAIDAIVGPALGLTTEHVVSIQKDT